MQDYINKQMKLMRKASLSNSPQITIGKLIEELARIPIKEGEQEQFVRFDFEYLVPTTFGSWRGSYEELALGYSNMGDGPRLSDFLDKCKVAMSATFVGYKGGDFTMNESTPVWVANYGSAGNTGIIGVKDIGYAVILLTGWCEF